MKFEFKKNEAFLLIVVILLSIAANLPEQYLGSFVERKYLLIVLVCIVVVSLFNYLDLLLFLCVVALSVGANLPAQLTESLGISPIIMLATLIMLVVMSVLNTAYKKFLREKSAEQSLKIDNRDSRKSLLAAISKGDITKLQWLLSSNVEINFSEDGASPVILAAGMGYTDIMQLLIANGADLQVMDAHGKTPVQIALANGFNRTAEVMQLAAEGKKPGWTKHETTPS